VHQDLLLVGGSRATPKSQDFLPETLVGRQEDHRAHRRPRPVIVADGPKARSPNPLISFLEKVYSTPSTMEGGLHNPLNYETVCFTP